MILFIYSIAIFPFSLYFFATNKCILMDWELFSVSGTIISFSLIFDPISISFSNVVCLISACVMCFSSSYMSQDPYLSRFIFLVMMFVLSMNFLVFIPNLIALLIGWDGLGIVSFALVVYYQNMKSMSAGMLTALANRVGDVMLLLSIGFCVVQGHWNIMFMWDTQFSTSLVVCLMIAGMTKSAQIPFSSWLPAAMAAPTPVSALVHSSTLVTAGIFILIRFFPILDKIKEAKLILLFISTLTLLMAGIGASYEYDLKKIIALSTLSQLGVMMMSLSLGIPFLALFHLYTHALFKAMLFLCAGAIIHNNTNSQDLRQIGNLWEQMPLTISCLNVANLALCGAPFMSGFYSKDLILETSLHSATNILMLMLIFLGTGMTALYSIRLSIYSLWGQSNHMTLHQNNDEDITIIFAIMVLSIITIFVGKVLQGVVLQFNDVLILPLAHKLLTILVTGFGGWFAWLISQTPKLQSTINQNNMKMIWFNSLMWFFVPLSTQFIVRPPLEMGNKLFKSLDRGWLEVFGGSGMLFTSSQISKTNQLFQSSTITTFVMLSLLSLMLFMLMCLFMM